MKNNNKIKHLNLDILVSDLNTNLNGQTIGLCHGVFDVLHSGHIRHFEEASKLVDILIVSVTSDSFVNKGPGRPVNSLNERIKILSSIEYVDFIVESDSFSSLKIIEAIKPNFYFKGRDYAPDPNTKFKDLAGNLKKEEQAVKLGGGAIHYTTTQINSSSSIINNITTENANEKMILEHVRNYFNLNPIDNIFNVLNTKKIDIIGEIILDKFIYTESLGKSGKHPVVAEREILRKEIWGGICPLVSTLESFLPEESTRAISIFNSNAHFGALPAYQSLVIDDSYTPIVKTRFINEKTNTFMYEIYEMEDRFITSDQEQLILNLLKSTESDLLIALDFGHGLITPNIKKLMSEKFNNFSLNVQKNAGNKGFSTIGKYNSASIIVMNGEEVELEFKQKGINLPEAAMTIHKSMKAKIVIITNGAHGLIVTNGEKVFEIPSFFSGNIKDRTGAGDSVFAIVSTFSLVIKDLIVLGYLGNLAAAMNLTWTANEKVITKADFVKAIHYSLK